MSYFNNWWDISHITVSLLILLLPLYILQSILEQKEATLPKTEYSTVYTHVSDSYSSHKYLLII